MIKPDAKKLHKYWLERIVEKHHAKGADRSIYNYAIRTPYGVVGTSFHGSDRRGAAPWIAFNLLDWSGNLINGWYGWDHWKQNLHIPDRCDFDQASVGLAFHASKFFRDQGQGFPLQTDPPMVF